MTYDAVVVSAGHNGLAATVHLAAVAVRTFPDRHPCRTLVRASCASERPPLSVGRTDHRLLDMALGEPPAVLRITSEAVDHH